MKTAQQLRDEYQELVIGYNAMIQTARDEKRELTKEEQAEEFRVIGDGTDKDKGVKGEYEALIKTADTRETNQKVMAAQMAAATVGQVDPPAELGGDTSARFKVPAVAKRHGKVKAHATEEEAYTTGQFIRAKLYGIESADTWCKDHGVYAAMSTSDNTKGGFLAPEVTEAAIIRIVEQYGVGQQYARVVPMSAEVENVPRYESGLTVYYPGEAGTITTSDMGLGNVKLTAIKRATLTAISSELNEDAIISVAEMLTQEIGHAFAKKQDQDLFLGDGSSTYGGVAGLASTLNAGSVQDAASGNVSFATLDLLDFENTVGKLPVSADNENTAWYIHKTGYAKSMLRLLDAAGGNTNVTLSDGVRSRPMFLGYPVVFTQAMPASDAVSTHQVYLGDLSMAATIGTRRGVTIATDGSVYFTTDQIGVRATERVAINVHEKGDATNAGSIIALKTAAS